MASVSNQASDYIVSDTLPGGHRRTRIMPLRRRGSTIDPESFELDDYITLPIAVGLKEMSVNGLPNNPSQVYRFCDSCVRGITLRSTYKGERMRVTTRRWIREFFERLVATDTIEALSSMIAPNGLARRRKKKASRSAWLAQ